MAGSYKAVIFVLLVAVCVWSLVAGDHAERRTERSVPSQFSSSEMGADLTSELQWLREKTAQVFHQHFTIQSGPKSDTPVLILR